MADSRHKKGLDEMLPDELLIRAKRIAGFFGSKWPGEFSPEQIARLMAGGHRGELRTDYDVAFGLVLKALVTGALVARKAPSTTVETPERPMIRIGRDESGRRVINCAPETPKAHTLYVVDRQACAAWLELRGAKPGRYPYIDEWLRTGGVVIGKPTEGAGKKTEAQQDRADCQGKCLALWEKNPTMTITGPHGVAEHNDLSCYVRKYRLEWVKGCAREVAPEQVKGKRGRPKKIADQAEK